MKFKKIILILIGFFVLFSSPSQTFASSVVVPASRSDTLKVTEEKIDETYTDLRVSGLLPVVEISGKEGTDGTRLISFNKEINAAIDRLRDERTQEAQRGKVSLLQFDYDLKMEDDIVSILIKTTYTRGVVKNEIDTVNFHITQKSFLKITDILGPNGVNISNRIISETIKNNPEEYNPNFNSINDSHNFYVESGFISIMFSENEIASASKGIMTFPIEIGALIDYTLPQSLYYTKDSYGLKMIPARMVCEAFGYEVSWNDSRRAVEITKGSLPVSFRIGTNEYEKGEESRTLEAAPEIKDGMAYIPISFFGDILDLAYSTDAKGTVTFTMYTEKTAASTGK